MVGSAVGRAGTPRRAAISIARTITKNVIPSRPDATIAAHSFSGPVM
jgi:hypothetical protein